MSLSQFNETEASLFGDVIVANISHITNVTHENNTYLYGLMERFPKLTFVQSFLLTFFTLIGDETFLLLIILKQKFPKSTLIFFAFLFSMLLLNTLSVLFGRSLDLLLYQNLIDFLSIIIFGVISITHFMKFFNSQKRKTYNQEIEHIINPTTIIANDEKSLLKKSRSSSRILNFDKREDYIYRKYYEGHNKGYLFWVFGKTILISTFGDAYMFGIITNSALSNFRGVLFGSSLAILVIVYLGCYHGEYIGSILSEGTMGVLIAVIYFMLSIEILYFTTYLNE